MTKEHAKCLCNTNISLAGNTNAFYIEKHCRYPQCMHSCAFRCVVFKQYELTLLSSANGRRFIPAASCTVFNCFNITCHAVYYGKVQLVYYSKSASGKENEVMF